MSDNNQEYQPGESYVEQEQQFIESGAPTMESYNPAEDDGMMPYIPSTQQGQSNPQQMYQPQGQSNMQGFIDLDQLGQQKMQAQQEAVQNNPNQQYQQNLIQMNQAPSGSNSMSAHKNLEILENAMNLVQDIASTTKKDGDSNRVYATDVALKSLYGAVSALKEIEYWIPEGKEEYVPKLTQIAKPIVDALQQYTDTIERLK